VKTIHSNKSDFVVHELHGKFDSDSITSLKLKLMDEFGEFQQQLNFR